MLSLFPYHLHTAFLAILSLPGEQRLEHAQSEIFLIGRLLYHVFNSPPVFPFSLLGKVLSLGETKL